MLKKIIDISLNNKRAIWILSIIIIFAVLYTGLNMKQETMPDIELPNVSVMTMYPGAAPDVVAEEVTEPIEQRIQHLDGVEILMSSSLANVSSVQVQFDYGTDMDKAIMEIQEALGNINVPEQAHDAEANRISINEFPVMAVIVSDNERSHEELTMTIEKDVLPQLEGINGLQEAQIAGQQIQEVSIKFLKDELEEYNLDEQTVTQLIQGSNLTFPLGLTTFKDEVKNVVIDGNVASIKDLEKIEIPYMPQMSGNIGMPSFDGAEQFEQMDEQEMMEQDQVDQTQVDQVPTDSSEGREEIGRAHV